MGGAPIRFKPDQLSALAVEQREPNWAEVEVIALATRERHNSRDRARHLVDDAMLSQHYIQFIQELLDRPDINLSAQTRQTFIGVVSQFKVYHSWLRHQLRPPKDIASALPRVIPEAATQQLVSLAEPEDSLTEVENIGRLDNALRRSQRRQIFSVSDSHVTTAYMMKSLHEEREPLHRVGIISFDHHTDLRNTRGVAKKENVMAHVLEQSRVGAVVIVGYDAQFAPPDTPKLRDQQLDRISGVELYSYGKPDIKRFMRELSFVFERWRDAGVTTLYTSVDLDGLRLPEQLYTATDYNPLDNIRGMLSLPPGDVERERLQAGAKDLTLQQAREAVHWLHNFLRVHQLTEYNGIPAAWVTRAMRLAKDHYGLEIGIRRTGTEQRIVGDIVEYTPPDYAQRTARITKALLGGMAKVAS